LIFWWKAVRDLRAMGVRAVLLALIVGGGVGTAAGTQLAIHDVRTTRDAFYQDQALADLEVRLRAPVPAEDLLARARAVGATAAESRLLLRGTVTLEGDRTGGTAAEVVGMTPDPAVNRLALVQGRGLSAAEPRGAVLEAEFARHEGVAPGDTLTAQVAGERFEVPIRGIARSPEYLPAAANPAYLVPQPGSLAVLFLPREGLAELVGMTGRANNLVVGLPPDAPASVRDQLTAGLPVADVVSRDQQFSFRFTQADLNSFETFAPILGLVFGAIGLLVIGLSLRRLVHSQRRELGALLAIGYSPGAVAVTVLLPATAIALAGAILAVGVAVLVARLISSEYANAVGFPEIVHSLAPAPLGLAAGLAITATLLATLFPLRAVTRLSPTDALRGDLPTRFDPPRWLRHGTAIGGPAWAYASRSLLRRPLLTAATVVSIAAAVGLGAALEIVATSTSRAVDQTFADQGWTYTAEFAGSLPSDQAANVAQQAGAPRVEPVVSGGVRLRGPAGDTEDAELVGLPGAPRLQHLTIAGGGGPGTDRIAVSEQIADDLGVGPGDQITVAAPTGEATMRVAGTVRTVANTRSYLPFDQAAELLGLSGEATAVLVSGGPEVAGQLRADPAVVRVTSKREAVDGMHELVAELTDLISVMLGISLVVGGLFLVSSLALSFLDRQGEFATLRALGHGRRSVSLVVAAEAVTMAVLAAVLSVPAGLALAWLLADQIGEAWFRIGLAPAASHFLVVWALLAVLTLVAVAHAARRALRLNIATVVRARLIG
jgi:putative ABC transport system permease protein